MQPFCMLQLIPLIILLLKQSNLLFAFLDLYCVHQRAGNKDTCLFIQCQLSINRLCSTKALFRLLSEQTCSHTRTHRRQRKGSVWTVLPHSHLARPGRWIVSNLQIPKCTCYLMPSSCSTFFFYQTQRFFVVGCYFLLPLTPIQHSQSMNHRMTLLLVSTIVITDYFNG